MLNPQLSILVVDDTKFSSAVIGHTLTQAGYRNIRFAASAMAALEMHAQQPAGIMIADWLMPEMDGLQLTQRIRQNDEQSSHYTYVILLTAREGNNALREAFDRGVDDFISKSAMSEQLLPRIYAADRTSLLINRLLDDNRHLTESLALLEDNNLIDPVTGLGNRRYLLQRLDSALRSVDSRGGACSLLLIGLQNLPELDERHSQGVIEELLKGVTRRIQQLLRPCDVITRINNDTFALLAIADNAEELKPGSFRRLHDGINLKAFKTSEGYLTLRTGLALCNLPGNSEIADTSRLLASLEDQLKEAYSTGLISELRWPPAPALQA